MNKRKNKLVAIASVFCMALAILCSPAAALPVQAAVSQEPEIMPMSDAISWRFRVIDGKLYKRLYNHSTVTWIGEWIYVCDFPQK